jgi:tRNA 2-thiocytidine biosynthesis protein TtcA
MMNPEILEAAAPTETVAEPGAEPSAKASLAINKLSKRLHRQVGQAIVDYNMIEEGDKVMVCLSGGKVIGTAINM